MFDSIIKPILPLLGIGVAIFVGYWIKLILDKNRNVKHTGEIFVWHTRQCPFNTV